MYIDICTYCYNYYNYNHYNYVYIYIYMYVGMYVCMCVYIYIERERERSRSRGFWAVDISGANLRRYLTLETVRVSPAKGCGEVRRCALENYYNKCIYIYIYTHNRKHNDC